jgi:hypothetical protein
MAGCETGAAPGGAELGGLGFLPHPANRRDMVRTALIVVVFINRSDAEREDNVGLGPVNPPAPTALGSGDLLTFGVIAE